MSNALPTLDLRTGHTVSTIVVALNGMVPGNYGDMLTNGNYVHVTREANGTWTAIHIGKRRESSQSNNALRVAQFIANRIEA